MGQYNPTAKENNEEIFERPVTFKGAVTFKAGVTFESTVTMSGLPTSDPTSAGALYTDTLAVKVSSGS